MLSAITSDRLAVLAILLFLCSVVLTVAVLTAWERERLAATALLKRMRHCDDRMLLRALKCIILNDRFGLLCLESEEPGITLRVRDAIRQFRLSGAIGLCDAQRGQYQLELEALGEDDSFRRTP